MVNETQNNVARQRIDAAFQTQAKHLDLSHLHITTLPREIGKLSNLESLDLSQNELSTLPIEIGQLYNLQRLDISGNPLVELPAEIGNLANLTHLSLFKCRLSSLPSEIGKLTNLIELDLSHNPLSSLPKEIDSLPNLRLKLSPGKSNLPRKNQRESEENILITILDHYRHLVKFSLFSTSGMYEILRLYVEVQRMYRCVPSLRMIEALFFGTNYKLPLIPTIRTYPLFPPSLNLRDTWVLKEKDAELFGIKFEWPHMMAVSVVIKADVFDYLTKQKKTVVSSNIWLQRNGESVTDTYFVPYDNPIPLTPYLYKLVTIDGFIERVNVPEAMQLNSDAYHEIARLFRCNTTEEMERLFSKKSKYDLMFQADIHPIFAARLIKIAPILRSYLGDTTIASTAILFLAADPTDASRLRLGEEFREIQEKLKLAKLREKFRLELPLLSVRPADITQALLDVHPQIVHFSGHGTSTGALCFENQTGQTQLVQPDALAALFEQFAKQISCVLLNACYSETQAKAIGKHIKYVIGMNQAIGDKAAIAFAIGFYQALGAGRTIEDAYKLGCVQIRLQGIPEHLTPVLIKEGHLQI